MARKRTPVKAQIDPAAQLFASGAPEWHEEEPVVAEKQEKQGADAVVLGLQNQIRMLQDQITEARRGQTALLAAGNQTVDPEPKVLMQMDTANLPDPVTNPGEYAAEIARRGQQMIASQREHDIWASRQQQKQNSSLETVWNNFSERYPDYAKHQKLVAAAAANVISAAKSRNIDVNRFVTGNSDAFFEEVTKEMQDMAGGDELFASDTENDDGQSVDDAGAGSDNLQAAVGDFEDTDDGRTAGVFGGQDSGGRPTPARKEENVDMFSELRKFQERGGWHL